VKLSCCTVHQFYRETMEVSDDMKPSSTDDSKSTSVDSAGTDEVAAVTNINDVEMKTEEGLLLTYLHCSLTC